MPYPYMPAGAQYAPYHPQGYTTAGNAYSYAQQPMNASAPIHGFIYVTGYEGAKAFQMPPNSEMPLFDSTNDGVMFIKTTDGAGFPTISIVDCYKRDATEQQKTSGEYVTRDELERVYSDLTSQVEQMKEAFHVTVPEAAEPADIKQGRHANAAG